MTRRGGEPGSHTGAVRRGHEVDIVLTVGPEAARIVAGALTPETQGIQGEVPRTSAHVAQEGGELHIRIVGDDAVALRAAVNSYVRWARAALDVAAPAPPSVEPATPATGRHALGESHSQPHENHR
ncbi:MAG: KEOPS complex subunit Pcc1 [Thermoplasmatota archaeon]